MSENLPEWLTVGAEVVGTWNCGYQTVTRVTKTLITLSDGTKWRTVDLYPVGTPPAGKRYGAGPIRLESKASHLRAMLLSQIIELRVSADRYRWNMNTENAEDLRNAIVAVSGHLGLTITRD